MSDTEWLVTFPELQDDSFETFSSEAELNQWLEWLASHWLKGRLRSSVVQIYVSEDMSEWHSLRRVDLRECGKENS